MGMYDSVMVECTECNTENEFQSKSGECLLRIYKLHDCPDDVLEDINRHSPIQCTNCGTEYFVHIQNRTLKYISKTNLDEVFNIPKSAQEWLLNGYRGISADTIFGAITGLWINHSKSPPMDISDFCRCYKLIEQVPEWRNQLHKVSKLSPIWKKVIDNWDKLSELLQIELNSTFSDGTMYKFMEELWCIQ